jgi:MraZ protein
VLTPSPFDACLHLFPMKAWEEFEGKIAALPQFEPNVIKLRRLYVSAATECEVDKHGRVLVPNSLRDHAGLHKDVLWAGMGQMVELWAKEKWSESQAMTPAELSDFRRAVAEQLRI